MFYTFSPLAPAALLVLSYALECISAPLGSSISSGVISIPLAKRYTYLANRAGEEEDESEVEANNSTNSDISFNATNVINLAAIKRHIAQVDAKYQQGVFNYQQNTGQIYVVPSSLSNPVDGYGNSDVQSVQDQPRSSSLPPQDTKAAFVGRFVTKVPKGSWSRVTLQNGTANSTGPHIARANAAFAKRRGATTARGVSAAPLQDLQNDLLWAGYVTIGSNGQQFLIDFDTGSSDFWVPSIGCQSEACKGHKRYNSGASISSVSVPNKEFSISYGDGSSSSGPVYRDDVSVDGLIAKAQCFSAVEQISDSFVGDLEDGILGMAYQSISELNEPPFFATLMAQKKVSAPIFSFRLAKKGSELYLGGVNPAKYTGAITWYPTLSQSYWLIAGVPQVNGAPITSGTYSMAVDTGTTVIIAPPEAAEQFWNRVPGASRYPYAPGYWQYPCNKPPRVSFVFAGSSVAWTVSTADFNLGQVSRGSTLCVGAIVGQDVGIKAWILGDSFLKSTYSIFDMQQNRVGFAKPV